MAGNLIEEYLRQHLPGITPAPAPVAAPPQPDPMILRAAIAAKVRQNQIEQQRAHEAARRTFAITAAQHMQQPPPGSLTPQPNPLQAALADRAERQRQAQRQQAHEAAARTFALTAAQRMQQPPPGSYVPPQNPMATTLPADVAEMAQNRAAQPMADAMFRENEARIAAANLEQQAQQEAAHEAALRTFAITAARGMDRPPPGSFIPAANTPQFPVAQGPVSPEQALAQRAQQAGTPQFTEAQGPAIPPPQEDKGSLLHRAAHGLATAVETGAGIVKDVASDPGAAVDIGQSIYEKTVGEPPSDVAWQTPQFAVEHIPEAAKAALDATDYPRREIGTRYWGDALNNLAEDPDHSPWLSDHARQRIIELHKQGGGKAVWEGFVASAADPLLSDSSPLSFGPTGVIVYGMYHALTDAGADPLMLLPIFGEAGGALRGLAITRAVAGDMRTARVLENLGRLIESPEKISQYTLDLPFTALQKGIEASRINAPSAGQKAADLAQLLREAREEMETGRLQTAPLQGAPVPPGSANAPPTGINLGLPVAGAAPSATPMNPNLFPQPTGVTPNAATPGINAAAASRGQTVVPTPGGGFASVPTASVVTPSPATAGTVSVGQWNGVGLVNPATSTPGLVSQVTPPTNGQAVGTPPAADIFDPVTGEHLPSNGVERFQWVRNAQPPASQTFGNQMEIRPLPGGGPDTHGLYVRKEGRGDWELVRTGSPEDLRPSSDPRVAQWWRPVQSFDDPEAVAWGRNYDAYDEATHGAPPPATGPETTGTDVAATDYPRYRDDAPLVKQARASTDTEAVARFDAEIEPTAEGQARRAAAEAMPYGEDESLTPLQRAEEKATKRIEQVTVGIDYTVDVVVPAFRHNFPNEPIDRAGMMTETQYVQTGGPKTGKGIINDRWLAQQYVYGGDDRALGRLSSRPGVTEEQITRLQDARAKFDAAIEQTPPGAQPGQGMAATETTPGGNPIRHVEDRQGVGVFEIDTPTGSYQVHGPGPGRYPWRAYQMVDEPFGRSARELKEAVGATKDRVMGVVDQLGGTPKGALPGQGMASPILDLADRLTPGPTLRTTEDVPGFRSYDNRGGGLAKTEVDRLADAGAISADAHAALSRQVKVGNKYQSVADLFDTLVAKEADEHGGVTKAIKAVIAHDFGTAEEQRAIRQGGLGELNQVKRSGGGRSMSAALRAYDAASRMARENIQYNIVTGVRGSLGDAIGDAMTFLVTGHPRSAVRSATGPLEAAYQTARRKVTGEDGDIARMVRATRHTENRGDLLNEMDASWPLRETGGQLPHEYLPGGHLRDQDPTTGQMVVKKALGRASGIVANKTFRDFRSALDLNKRMTFFLDQFNTNLKEGQIAFRRLLEEKAGSPAMAKTWMDQIGASAKARVEAQGQTWNGLWSDADIRQALNNEPLARAWRSEVTKAKTQARQEVSRVLFSYKRGKADEVLGRLFFFHYWQTRAIALHGRAALRNPWLLGAYWRMWQGMDRMAEEGNYPESAKAWIKFMGSKDGWYGLFNPMGILLPFSMFQEMGGQKDDAWWKSVGKSLFFVNPMLEGAAAALGLGDRPGDMTGTSTVMNMARAIMEHGNAHGLDWMPYGDKPGANPITSAQSAIIDKANQALRSINLTSKDFGPYDPTATAQVNIRDRIEQIAAENPGKYTQEDIDDAKARTLTGASGSDLYDQAWSDYTDAQLGGRIASAAVPGGVRMVSGPLEQRRDDAAAFWAAGGYDNPTPDPTLQAAAEAMQSTNAGSAEALSLNRENKGYHAIGTERQQSFSDGWSTVAYGDLQELGSGYLKVGGHIYWTNELAGMPTEQRIILANRWVEENGGTAELADFKRQRDAYVASHPEYQQYDTYADAIRKSADHGRAFRLQAEKDHPEFADELDKRRQSLMADGKRGAVLENELDDWTVGIAGYNAFRGVRESIYDEPPEAAYNPSADPYGGSAGTTVTPAAATGSTGGYDPVASLTDELTRYNAQLAIASDLLGTDTAHMSPYVKKAYQNVYLMPVPSRDLEMYLKWSAGVPKGQDNSVAAYIDFMNSLKYRDPAA